MASKLGVVALVLATGAFGGRALASEVDGGAEAQVSAAVEAPDAGAPDRLEARLAKLEAENARLEDTLAQLQSDAEFNQTRLESVLPVKGRLSGYVDFGLFWVQGDGEGITQDGSHLFLPQYRDVGWVFMGDPLSTAINSRGDPADVNESRAIRFNPIGAGDHPSFIVNAINLSLFGAIGENLSVNALIDILPRTRIVSDPGGLNLGDYLDAKLAYAQYNVPTEAVHLVLFAGKFDSVLGYEYRSQESPDRLTVSPSLICRYTCGHPLGLKARVQLLDDALAINLAVTNGSSMIEAFGFSTETDTNFFKTASSRISYKLPIGSGLEVGVSGSLGAQDAQDDESVLHWHYGFDLHLDVHDLELTAEFVKGLAEGQDGADATGHVASCGSAPCINYRGAYGLVGYRVTNWWEPYARVDWRNAIHRSGDEFVYFTKIMRATVGSRFDLGPNVAVKAEYTFNEELGPLPSFSDDVFTSSLVLKY